MPGVGVTAGMAGMFYGVKAVYCEGQSKRWRSPQSVNARSQRACRACATLGCRRARGLRVGIPGGSARPDSLDAVNRAPGASAQRIPSPCAPNRRSRTDTARRTIKADGDGDAGPGVVDLHSKVASGEGTGGAEVETVVTGAIWEGDGRISICLDNYKRAS